MRVRTGLAATLVGALWLTLVAGALAQDNPAPVENGNSIASGSRACLGMTLQHDVEDAGRAQVEHGLRVMTVDPHGPAEKAGMLPRHTTRTREDEGDLIVAVNDHRVHTEEEFGKQLERVKPGQIIFITLLRNLPDGGAKTIKVKAVAGAERSGVCVEAAAAASTPSAIPTN